MMEENREALDVTNEIKDVQTENNENNDKTEVKAEAVAEKPVSNRTLWFLSGLPLIGLLFEGLFCTDKISAAALWIMVVAMSVFCAFLDYKDLVKAKNVALMYLKKVVWLPPVYISRRAKLCGLGAKFIVFFIVGCFFVFRSSALVNSFFVTDQMIIDTALSDSYESDKTQEYRGISFEKVILEFYGEEKLNDSIKVEIEELKDEYLITVVGTVEENEKTVYINVKYDGYFYYGSSISDETDTAVQESLKDIADRLYDELKNSPESENSGTLSS